MSITPFILLTNNKIQNFVVKQITEHFEEKTGAKFEIEHVSLKFFNKISINSVIAKDLSNEVFLNIDELDTEFSLFSLLNGDLIFNNLTANNLNAYLRKDLNGELNIQFLIEHFKPKKKIKTPNLIFPQITLNNASFRYIDLSNQSSHLEDWQFNTNNIFVDQLFTKIQLSLIDQTNLDAQIDYLRFKEQSGFCLHDLKTHIITTDSSLTIPFAFINLPNSKISTDSIHLKVYKNENASYLIEKTECNFNISKGYIILSDLKHFIPELEHLNKPASISAKIHGSLNDIKATNFKATYDNILSISADINIIGLPNLKNAYFNGSINHIIFDKSSLQDIIAKITKQPFTLPKEISNLGICQYSGKISGYISNLVLYGKLKSKIGTIKTDANLQVYNNFNSCNINGKISSNNLQIGQLLPQSGLEEISFTSNSQINLSTENFFSTQTKIKINSLKFQNYNYKNIEIDGYIEPSLFSGKLLLNDPNGFFSFDGTISESNKIKHFNFSTKVDKLNLNKLNIIKTHPNLNISISTKANFSGDNWATMTGYINIDSLLLTNKEKSYFLKHLSLAAQNDSSSSISIRSDIINGDISGKYFLPSILNSAITIAAKSMPILNKYTKDSNKENDLTFILEIDPLKNILQTLEIPWYTTEKSSIYATLNTLTNKVESDIYIPNLSNGKTNISDINFNLNNNKNNQFSISLSGSTNLKNSKLNAELNLKAINNTITTTCNWENDNPKKLFAGEFIAQTALTKSTNDSIIANTTILPTELIIQDKPWIIEKSSIFSDFRKIIINNLKIHSNDEQLIAINGVASSNKQDSINIQLKDISLDYINELLPENASISFGGLVNGNASVKNTFKIPEINANVISNNFSFNESYFGTAVATCNFEHETSSLNFDGTIISDSQDTIAVLGGNYYIPIDSLDIKGHSYGLDVSFIDYYLANIFGRVKGNAWGDVHIHGYTKKKEVAVDVTAYAENASIYVDFLKTSFYFSDSIIVNKNIIDFGHINIYDNEGHTGHISGKIKHNYFQDINLDLDINVNNMLVMNTTRNDIESFYGKVYGSGNAKIFGDQKEIKITCNARSNKGTSVIIPIDNYYASENSFIIFQDNNNLTSNEIIKNTTINDENNTNIILDLMLEITPDAHLDLIIDSKAGDMITGNGNGNLRVTYDINADDMKIYGNVQIEQGKYLFTFQNVLRKEFFVKEGSSLVWTGDPLGADLHIDAYYQLTADLAEILDEAILSNTSRTSVPVQCLLNLTGLLTHPNIKFNLNLPNSEEELNRALQNTVNTDELMNRQIIALLILGKFIPPENLQNNNVFTQNELYSVVSSTLSAQLNNWASQIFDNWGFGVNFRTTGEGDNRTNEYEFNFIYTPTNRISINGNLGYRDDALSTSPFIGDFDFEYKLIQSGKLRAKAYTHTNDYREFKKGLTTQGIGIIYSENFNNIKELWKSWQDNANEAKKERITRKKQRKILKEKKEKEKEKKELPKNYSKN